QGFGDRYRYGLYLVDFTLNAFQQRAGCRRLLWLRLRLAGDLGDAAGAENGFVTADAGHGVAGKANQLVVVIEHQADPLLQASAAGRLNAEELAPAIGVAGYGE